MRLNIFTSVTDDSHEFKQTVLLVQKSDSPPFGKQSMLLTATGSGYLSYLAMRKKMTGYGWVQYTTVMSSRSYAEFSRQIGPKSRIRFRFLDTALS